MRQPTWQQVATDAELWSAIVQAAMNYTSAWHAADDLDPDRNDQRDTAEDFAIQMALADDSLHVLRELATILIARQAEEGRR